MWSILFFLIWQWSYITIYHLDFKSVASERPDSAIFKCFATIIYTSSPKYCYFWAILKPYFKSINGADYFLASFGKMLDSFYSNIRSHWTEGVLLWTLWRLGLSSFVWKRLTSGSWARCPSRCRWSPCEADCPDDGWTQSGCCDQILSRSCRTRTNTRFMAQYTHFVIMNILKQARPSKPVHASLNHSTIVMNDSRIPLTLNLSRVRL